jgi:hypothetical protein
MSLSVQIHPNSNRRHCHESRYIEQNSAIANIHIPKVIVGGLSGLVFTLIVMLASFITTFFMSAFEEPSYSYYPSFIYVSPLNLAHDLITAALRILKDGDTAGLFDDGFVSKASRGYGGSSTPLNPPMPSAKPSILKKFVRRFILGLPMVGAGSLVHMLLSVPLLGPLQWLARQRGGGRRRRDQSRDIAALVIVAVLVVGAARSVPLFNLNLHLSLPSDNQGLV